MALDNIPTLGPGGFNGNLDKVLVYKNGGSEVACSLLTLTNSALNPAGLYLDPVNQRVGIGTTTPQAKLDVRTTDGFGSVQTYFNNASSAPLRILRANNGVVAINTLSSGGTIDSPTDRSIAGGITRFTGNAYVDGDYRALARMEYYLDAIPTAGVAPCSIRFLTVPASSSTYSLDERMGITSDGNVQINESIVFNRNAKLFIKGSGSTAATTSLLVQNSSGTEIANFRDDLRVSVRNEFRVLDSAGNNAMIMFGDGYGDVRTLWVNGSLGVGVLGNNASARLQVDSTTQGFLPPRMTSAQKNLIASPAAGLMVYDTDLNRPCFHSGSAWVTL